MYYVDAQFLPMSLRVHVLLFKCATKLLTLILGEPIETLNMCANVCMIGTLVGVLMHF